MQFLCIPLWYKSLFFHIFCEFFVFSPLLRNIEFSSTYKEKTPLRISHSNYREKYNLFAYRYGINLCFISFFWFFTKNSSQLKNKKTTVRNQAPYGCFSSVAFFHQNTFFGQKLFDPFKCGFILNSDSMDMNAIRKRGERNRLTF